MILQYSFPPPICTLFHFSDADSDSDVELDSLCNSPGTRDSGINEDCILLGIGPWEGLLDVVKVREGEGEGGGGERQAGGEGERMEYKTYVEYSLLFLSVCLSVCLFAQSCECHVPDSEVLDPGGYYRAVCKTMVEEAIEIRALQVSIFSQYSLRDFSSILNPLFSILIRIFCIFYSILFRIFSMVSIFVTIFSPTIKWNHYD